MCNVKKYTTLAETSNVLVAGYYGPQMSSEQLTFLFFLYFTFWQMNIKNLNVILHETDCDRLESIIANLAAQHDYVHQLHPRYINNKYHIPLYRFTSERKKMLLRKDNYELKNI